MNEETRALLAELLCASQKHVYACVCACGMPQMPLPITSFSRALFYFKFGIRISSSSNYLQWSSFFQFRKPRDLFMFFYIKCCFFKMSQKEKKNTSGIVPKLLLLSHPNTHTFSTSSCTCTIHPSSGKTNSIFFYIHIVHIFPHWSQPSIISYFLEALHLFLYML